MLAIAGQPTATAPGRPKPGRRFGWGRAKRLPYHRQPMALPRLAPRTFQRLTLVAVVAVAFIIVTGGAVRLTGSGLGCPNWPTCTGHQVVAPVSYHPLVEFVNRVVTGLVSVMVI